MQKVIFLLTLTTFIYSCRKDDTPPIEETGDYWNYTGTFDVTRSSYSHYHSTNGGITTISERDLLYKITQVNDSIFFNEVGFPISSVGQLVFKNETSLNGEETTTTLTFSSDLNSISVESYYSDLYDNSYTNSDFIGTKSTLIHSDETGIHPRKNEIDGVYVLTYSETEYQGGAIVFDTTYTDTTTVSIVSATYGFQLQLDSTILSLPQLLRMYDSNSDTPDGTTYKDYMLNNDSIYINYNFATVFPIDHSDWTYSGFKL